MDRPTLFLSALFLVASAASAAAASEVGSQCKEGSDCGAKQRCGKTGLCECHPGHLVFVGECAAIRHHGEKCEKQIECTLSGDPNLKCVKNPDDEETEGQCRCRPGYHHSADRKRCFPTGYDPAKDGQSDRPSYIRLEPKDHHRKTHRYDHEGTPVSDDDTPVVVLLERNLSDIYNRARNRDQMLKDSIQRGARVLGPVSLVLAGLLLFGCCVCFWSVRDPEARRRGGGGEGCEEVDNRRAGLYGVSEVSDAEAPTYRSAKYLEDGLSVGRGMMAVIPPDAGNGGGGGGFGLSPPELRGPPPMVNQNRPQVGSGGGEDNAGFHQDNMDALSHFTTQTEVCDASHVEYIDRTAEDGEEEVPQQRQAAAVAAQGEVLQRDAAAAGMMLDPTGYESNIKMIFKHSQEVSLTPSMDEADVEVAGIYKTFSSNVDPLAARIENLPTPPPQQQKRVIELVETDDCTSIDTNIPEEEVAQFQRGMDRQKELSMMDDSIKEETEEELSRHNSSDDTGSIKSGIRAPETPREARECAEFVDNAFKPVFSIS